MAVAQATRIGCGRHINDVWDHIDRAPDEHEQGCPYCTQARADLTELSSATRELAAADREDSTLQVPDGMLSDVLAIVRTQVRRGRTLPLQRYVSDLTISEQVIVMVVREVCDRNPDLEVRRVSIDATPVPTPVQDGPAVEPADLRIDLHATVRPHVAIPGLLRDLRSAVQSAVTAQIGVTVSRIDIDVVDLIDV